MDTLRSFRILYIVLGIVFAMQVLGFFVFQSMIDDRISVLLEEGLMDGSFAGTTVLESGRPQGDLGGETLKLFEERLFDNYLELVDYIDKREMSILSDVDMRIATLDVPDADFSSVIDGVLPSVVTIKAGRGYGSGVIVDSQGFIVTNAHVVRGKEGISVIVHDGMVYDAQVIGYGTVADIAILKIEGSDHPSLVFGGIPVPGERVIAIGSPLGLSFTITEGIVSAVERVVDMTGIGYVQTDVSINPGNSGGPLINADMQIVGINTFTISSTQGLGFAIPADIAQAIVWQAIESYEKTVTIK